jgi:hypothetical protein
MAAELPRRHLTLAAASAADDVGFVSLADLARALPEDGDFRLIGGHMVTLHVHRWDLGADLYRETGDSDLGATPLMLADGAFVARLEALGYHQVAGDRWVRDVADIPAGPGAAAEAAVDLLVPAWRCLEVGRAARLGPDDLATGRLVEVGAILRHAFDRPDGAALRALLRYRKLVGPAAAQIGTRIAALLDSVCGTS